IANEGVVSTVRIVPDQIRGVGLEGDEAPVGGDRLAAAAAVCLVPGGVDTHPLGHARREVVNEGIRAAVGVAADQVRGEGGEGDEAAVGGDPGEVAVAVSLRPGGADARPLRLSTRGGSARCGGPQRHGEDTEHKHDYDPAGPAFGLADRTVWTTI